MSSGETRLIARFFDRKRHREDVPIGIGDDAAALRLPPGDELVATVDTVAAGVHFPVGFDPADVGYRALAVNLSDIAAMGAEPLWSLLSVSLPEPREDWLGAFSNGFFSLADRFDVALVGGDLVRGPLSVTVTLLGRVPAGAAITRAGGQPGDRVFVTGVPGTAARGLASLTGSGDRDSAAEAVFRRPQPRVLEGRSLRGLVSAMIDISDGLASDVGHLAAASGTHIRLDPDSLRALTGGNIDAALRGGDDYELAFCCPAERVAELGGATSAWDCAVTAVGTVGEGAGVSLPGYDLAKLTGYDHFSSGR